MVPQPRPRDRWLALALLLGVLAAGYLVLVHPWWTQPLMAVNADIQTLRERDQRVRAQLQQSHEIADRLEQARRELATRPGFLPETSLELASAGLVRRLEEAVLVASPGNRSCAISNRSPLPADTRDNRFTKVAVQVRLRCGTPELANVLHALESGSPRLFVSNLNLLAQRFKQSPNETGTGLDVAFELSGYLQPRPGVDPGAEPLAGAGGPGLAAPHVPEPPPEAQHSNDEEHDDEAL